MVTRLSACTAMLLAALGAAPVSATPSGSTRSCAPPRGPGDSARHSVNLRVENISCAKGRRVALACARLSYGRSGNCFVLGYDWRCTSTEPPGSESTEKCVSGRRSIRITWTD